MYYLTVAPLPPSRSSRPSCRTKRTQEFVTYKYIGAACPVFLRDIILVLYFNSYCLFTLVLYILYIAQ